MLNVGDMAPDFTLLDTEGREVTLSSFRGKKVVLYFYPKDNTPGCTKEAKEFTAESESFNDVNAVVIGISKDSQLSHQKFVEKHGLKVLLLSDPDHKVIEAYGAWKPKKMMGREFMGIVRSTLLIGEEGKIENIWNKVKVKNHVLDVLNSAGGSACSLVRE